MLLTTLIMIGSSLCVVSCLVCVCVVIYRLSREKTTQKVVHKMSGSIASVLENGHMIHMKLNNTEVANSKQGNQVELETCDNVAVMDVAEQASDCDVVDKDKNSQSFDEGEIIVKGDESDNEEHETRAGNNTKRSDVMKDDMQMVDTRG
eukprot:272058_1